MIVSSRHIVAPAGTSFTRFDWVGYMLRRDCRWALELYAELANGATKPIAILPGNRSCGRSRLTSGAAVFRPLAGEAVALPHKPQKTPLDRGTRIVQRLICKAPKGQDGCSTAGSNYITSMRRS